MLPADRHGIGSASYTLFLDGEPLWSRELPFAFRRCVVRDDGVAAGFAYRSYKFEIWEELRVAAISPTGEVLWVHPPEDAETLEGERSREPIFGGIHLHGDGETLMLRSMPGRGIDFEEWWAFDLMTGTVDQSVTHRLHTPRPGPRSASRAGRGVPGTPLALVLWIEFGYGRPADGVRYILHAADGRLVWELNLPDGLGSDLLSDDQAEAALLAVGERSFEIALLKDDLRVAYAVEQGEASQWVVRETARSPLGGLQVPTPPVQTTPWRAVELELLGEVVFRADGDPPVPGEPPAPLSAFDVDASGTIGGVHATPGGQGLTFVLLDAAGRVLRSFELDEVEQVEVVRWVRDSTWFLHGKDARPSAAWLDLERGEVIAIEDCNGKLEDAELHPDGDLLVASRDAIHRFTPPGAAGQGPERSWADPRFDRPAAHLAIRPDGALAVAIHSYPARIELLRSDGVRDQVVELEQQLGEHGHVDELLATADGTLWFRSRVYDRQDGPPVWHRLDAELQPLEPVVLRLASDADVGVMLERVGPDGNGWGRDAWGPIRFDLASYRAEPVGSLRIRPLGGYVEEVAVDTQGRIYLGGEGDAIFVFDSGGSLLHVCRPERGDSVGELDMEWIAVRGDGHVFGGDEWEDQRLEFDEHGRRVGLHVAGRLEEQWAFWPGGMKRWVLEWPGTIERRGPDGVLEASFDRLHDGSWFTGAWPFSAARDGSFAFSRLGALHIFDASGAPRSSRSLAYDADEPGYWYSSSILHEGDRTILFSSGRLVAIHWDHPVAEVCELPEDVRGPVFRSPDGAELWVFASEARMLRFAAPPGWR